MPDNGGHLDKRGGLSLGEMLITCTHLVFAAYIVTGTCSSEAVSACVPMCVSVRTMCLHVSANLSARLSAISRCIYV